MIELQKSIQGENATGKPTITIRFDETKHPSEWSTIQYITNFLSASGFSTETVSALQTLIDSNTTP